MSNKHYQEQKMLIENFRKWQSEALNEEQELDEVFGLGGEFGDGWAVWAMLQPLAMPSATLYVLGPYLKLAVHHPSVQDVLMNQDKTSGKMFRAMAVGLKGADNAGQWLQNFVDQIFNGAKDGEEMGIVTRLGNALALLAFLTVLATTSFPIVGGALARTVPKLTIGIKKAYVNAKKKAKQIKATVTGEPTPDELEQIEKELDELEQLEREKQEAVDAAATVSQVLEMIKEDPMKAAEQLGVELSDADVKSLRADTPADDQIKSKAIKFEPRKNADQ